MKITPLSNNSSFNFAPYLVFLFSIITGLAFTLFCVRATAQADPGTLSIPSPLSDPYLVMDINPGAGHSYPSYFTLFKDNMYFQADDGVHGAELWVSDGSVAGTSLYLDILPGSQGSNPSDFVVLGDKLFFTTRDANGDKQLWISDGTLLGTTQVPGAKSRCELFMYCPRLVILNGLIYFYGGDQDHGYELWKTDGTQTGTVMVKDINPGNGSSIIVQLMNGNGTLYFFAYDGIHGFELWKSDGTTSGTALVKDINPGPDSSADEYGGNVIVDIGDVVFFKANDGIHGIELWKSDGTADQTQLVSDINPGGASSIPITLTKFNQQLFFYAIDAEHGIELWKSDGTTYGTSLVKDIWPGGQGKGVVCPIYQLGPIYHGYLYFEADTDTALQLWRTNGTEVGTSYVMDITSGPDAKIYMTSGELSINNLLYVHRYISGHYGLWTSDGINPPTLVVADIEPSTFTLSSPNPRSENIINDNYLFSAYSTQYGYELWTIPVTTQSELYLSLASQNIIKAGRPVTYTINFSDIGATNATNVILTDTLSTSIHDIQCIHSGVSISLTSTSPYVWEVADLAPGDGGVITISAVVNSNLNAGDVITNSAEISAQMSDGFLLIKQITQSTIGDIPPALSEINDVNTHINQATAPVDFTISDEDTSMDKLTVTGVSSNPSLIPDDQIAFFGDGSARTMVITPGPGLTGTALITVTVQDETSSVFDTFTVHVNPYLGYLPLLRNSFPIYIPPGIYPTNRCTQSNLYIRGNYVGVMKTCVPSVEVKDDGYMQFNYTWTIDLISGIPSIIKYDDADNPNMYITDNLGNRYDHVAVGGAAADTVTMYDNIPVYGWFLFIPARQSANTFEFHDDDQGTKITDIRLLP